MTEKVKFAYYNLASNSASDITAATEDTFFPASNLRSHLSTKVYRSTVPAATVVFDLKTTEDINIIMAKPNFVNSWGFNGDILVEANPSDSWGSPAYSATLTADQTYQLGILLPDVAQSYRFFRLSATGTTYTELANIFIGSYFEPGKNVNFNWSYEDKDRSTKSETRYGQYYIDTINNREEIRAQIQYLNSDEFNTFNTFIDYVGNSKPFWIIFDSEEIFSPDKHLFAGQFFFTKRPSVTNVAFGYYSLSMTMIEAV